MKSNTKSSITLPAPELREVERLQKILGIKSKVEVIRRGLRLLAEKTDRDRLRAAYHKASLQTHTDIRIELEELNALPDESIK